MREFGEVTPLRIVLIGPECTGKTSLATRLAAHYRAPCSAEFAREYVARYGRNLSYDDVDAIGQGQKAVEDATIARAAALGSRLVILDTDLVSTMVYSRHYYDDCPLWIEKEACRRLGELYLLHQIDVEWVADGLQRGQPERREELYVRFRATLELVEARVAEIEGDWAARWIRALALIDACLTDVIPG